MSLFRIWVACVGLLFSVQVYAGAKLADFAAKNSGKSLAIVSISANNFANSLQGWNSADTTALMGSRLNTMLEQTETLFAKDFKIVNAASFASKPEFQALAGEQREVGLPKVGDSVMPLFSKNRKQLIKAMVDDDVAQKLAKITGADFILIVYSEWGVATGRFVPTSKALAKNVISIYDAKGKQVFKGRQDAQGDKTLGGMGRVAVDKDTIDQWVLAFNKGVTALFNQGRKQP